MMKHLLGFPPILWHNLLVEWLNLQHVCRLDEASCKEEYRTSFLRSAFHKSNVYHNSLCCETVSSHHGRSGEEMKGMLAWAVSRKAYLTVIKISNEMDEDDHYRDRVLATIGAHVTTIEAWDSVYNNENWKRTLNDLSKHCPNITSIACTILVDSSGYMQMSQRWPLLQALVFPYGAQESDLVLIGQHCKNLRDLWVRTEVVSANCWNLCLEGCGANLVTLKGVKINQHSTKKVMHSIARYCPQLQMLWVNELIEVTDARRLWGEIVQGCPRLNSLFYSARSGKNTLLALEQLGTQLQSLNLATKFWFPEHALVQMADSCSNLKRLIIYDRDRSLSNHTFVALAKTCPHMEELGMHRLYPWTVTDTAAYALANSCHKLISLALPGSGVTDAGLIALMAVNPGLTHLDMESCSYITDISLQAVPLLCPHMRSLNLYKTMMLLDSVLVVLQGCRLLRHVNVPSYIRKKAEEAFAGLERVHFRPGLRLSVEKRWLRRKRDDYL